MELQYIVIAIRGTLIIEFQEKIYRMVNVKKFLE